MEINEQVQKELMHLYKCIAYILEDNEEQVVKWVERSTALNLPQIRIYSPVENLEVEEFMSSFSSEQTIFAFNYMQDIELEHESKQYWYCLCINILPCIGVDPEQIHVVLNALIHAIRTNDKTAEQAIDDLILIGVLKNVTKSNNP